MDKLFLDTNILLDVANRRHPHYADSLELMDYIVSGQAIGGVAALSFSNIAYVLRKQNTRQLQAFFRHLRSFLDISPMAATEVDRAIASKFTDFEDALQWHCACEWGATHLITRNIQDFPAKRKPRILSPAQYLKR